MRRRITLMMILLLLLSGTPMIAKQAEAASPDDVAAYAKQFLGTPYLYGGTTPSGFDCSGYIRYVFNHFGISLPRTSADQAKVGTAVSKSDLQRGDLVFFANTYKPGISHAGIYIGNGNVISAESEGIAISNLDTNPYWGPRYATARRMSGVSGATGTFGDVSTSHPAYEAIEVMNDRGIVKGYTSTEFRPESQVTRGQAAEMVNRVLKLVPQTHTNFSDVSPTNEFADSISAMQEAGILKGYSSETFGLYDPLTRGQLAVIMDRAFAIASAGAGSASYSDVPTSYWGYDAIVALKAIDATPVFQSSRFDTHDEATRAEFTAAVYSSM